MRMARRRRRVLANLTTVLGYRFIEESGGLFRAKIGGRINGFNAVKAVRKKFFDQLLALGRQRYLLGLKRAGSKRLGVAEQVNSFRHFNQPFVLPCFAYTKSYSKIPLKFLIDNFRIFLA